MGVWIPATIMLMRKQGLRDVPEGKYDLISAKAPGLS